MKKIKKHTFAHRDPETIVSEPKKEKGNLSPEPQKTDPVAPFVYRDLKRTGYIIAIFLLILSVLYIIQQKTDYLAPVLKIFGL